MLDRALDDRESSCARDSRDQERKRETSTPSPAAGDDEATRQRCQPGGCKDLARKVQRMTVPRRLSDVTAQKFPGGARDRQVDQEDRTPTESGDEDAAEHGSGGQSD